MAHHGEEITFGPIGGLCFLGGLLERNDEIFILEDQRIEAGKVTVVVPDPVLW